MADSLALPARAQSHAASLSAIPWYVWASVVGVTSAMIGVQWDISWHRSIGRDTFWTPPHIAIYLCGIIAGISSAYLILATTFGKLPQVRPASVRMWGFYGPLGAFITAWGGVAMLVSAPFDDWWHTAYGLDVKILSPPHVVLATGIVAIEVGARMLVLGYRNRAEGVERTRLTWLVLYISAMILIAAEVLTMEYTDRVLQHTGSFYIATCIVVPSIVIGGAMASRHKWGAAIISGIYMLFVMLLIWILPLFPAEPKLGPVYNPVTQFIPPGFPILLVVPAIAIDLLRRKIERWNAWLQALVYGVSFWAIFIAVQWPFANFLMTPAAANAFFGTIYRDYGTGPNSLEARNLFFHAEPNFLWLMIIALGVAVLTSRLGVGSGRWMATVKR
jgi:hypothetical protein